MNRQKNIEEILEEVNGKIGPGSKVMFHGRMIYLGEIVLETPFEFIIKNACWMQSMGIRTSALMANGIVENTRVEVYPPDLLVGVPRAGFVRKEWRHPLPTKDQPA